MKLVKFLKRNMYKVRLALLGILSLVLVLAISGTARAQYSSSNYKTNEVFFGSGGDYGQSSTNYQGSASVGALGVGQVSSSTYQAYAGFLTPNTPFLEMQIDTSSVSLGNLSNSSTSTGTATFHVRAYLNSGYTVQITSDPPSTTSGAGSHTLSGMPQGGSVIGTEQFGINLKANTSPAVFGADPSPQPTGTFAFGQAATGYSTQNQYKYSNGDVIACSGTSGSCGTTSGWGQTNYTIAYIANISIATPAGSYSAVQDLVCVPTY